jgi:hypothetical protein
MRRPWIKIEICTPDKPEVCSLATQLRMDSDAVVGKLIRLWSWAELNRIDPNDLGVTREFIDKLVGRKGFAQALEKTGWLIETGEKLSFRNFKRHNSPVAQNKALTAKRVARHRLRKSSDKVEVTVGTLPISTVRTAPKPKKAKVLDTAANVDNTSETLDSSVLVNVELVDPIMESAPPTLEVIEVSEETAEPVVEAPAETVEEPLEVVSEAPPASVSNYAEETSDAHVAAAEETVTPAPAADEEYLAAPAPEEPAQRKRRSKAAAALDDQPMLF